MVGKIEHAVSRDDLDPAELADRLSWLAEEAGRQAVALDKLQEDLTVLALTALNRPEGAA